jgi:RNA polymerase sigma-70 factor, ECF subfamily
MRGDRVRTSQAQKWPAPVPLPGAAYPDWEAIYADNVGRIYRLMFSKVANRPDAEDLTSQVFLAAYGPLRATAEVAQVRAYLTATARTVLAEHWRRTLGHQVTEIDLETTDLENFAGAGTNMWAGSGSGSGSGSGPGAGGDGDAGVDGTHAGGGSSADERTARILEALPQRQRQILILRFLRGYSIRQAATELGVTVANAKVMQHRALRAAARMEDSKGDGAERAGGLGTSEESGLRWGSGRESGRESGQGRRQEPGRELRRGTGTGSGLGTGSRTGSGTGTGSGSSKSGDSSKQAQAKEAAS